MSVRGFPPKYRFLTPGHLRLAHQISKVGENLAHLNTRKKWFACHVQIAGRRTNEEEDESEENGVRQVGPRIGAWACARDAPSFLSVVARHTRGEKYTYLVVKALFPGRENPNNISGLPYLRII